MTSPLANARIYRANGITAYIKEATVINLHYAELDVHKERIDVFVYRKKELRVFLEKMVLNWIISIMNSVHSLKKN